MTATNSRTEVEVCPNCGREFPLNTGFCESDASPLMVAMPDPMIGVALPRHYRIIGKLGRGAMSMVYRGVYEPLDQPVAIKLLKSHLVSDVQSFKRFQQEAKTAGALEHPNIVAIFDFGVTDQGVPYLIMDLIQGDSLYKILRQQKWLPIDAALRIFIQAADALEYTHQRGVIHRDIKPSNILITHKDANAQQVKIVDFGIAKIQDYEGNPAASLTQTGEVFGTPLYISPEQAMGQALDARADIYSLGCVMYEAIAGRPAFNAPTAFDVLRLQCTKLADPIDMFRPAHELPPSLVTAIDRCMEKDPSERYQSMADLIIDLQRAEIEYAIRQEALADGRGTSRSQVTPIEGLRAYRDQPEQRSATPARPITVPTGSPRDAAGSAAQPAAFVESNLNVPPLRAASKLVSPNAVRSSSAIRFARRADEPANKGAPIVAAILSGAAGCLCGIVVLAIAYHPSAPPAAKPLTGKALESEQVRPESQSRFIDQQTLQVREAALNLYDQGDYAAAESQILKALSAVRDKRETMGAGLLQADLCMIDIAMKKYVDAYDAGNSAVNILDGKADVAPKDLAFAMRGFGTACFYRNDLPQAEKMLRRSTQLDRSVYGPNDERYGIGITRLAKVLESQKKFDEAEVKYREALAVAESCHQPGDQHYALRMRTLAQFLRKRKHPQEAQLLERQARALETKEAKSPQPAQ